MSMERDKFRSRFRKLVSTLDTENFKACAKLMGITVTTFNNAYLFGILPSKTTVANIAKFFNVSSDYLLGKTDEK